METVFKMNEDVIANFSGEFVLKTTINESYLVGHLGKTVRNFLIECVKIPTLDFRFRDSEDVVVISKFVYKSNYTFCISVSRYIIIY